MRVAQRQDAIGSDSAWSLAYVALSPIDVRLCLVLSIKSVRRPSGRLFHHNHINSYILQSLVSQLGNLLLVVLLWLLLFRQQTSRLYTGLVAVITRSWSSNMNGDAVGDWLYNLTSLRVSRRCFLTFGVVAQVAQGL